MASIEAAANYVLGKMEPTPLQLHKILYYAQGIHYAKHGDGIMMEPFEAWSFGPVIPSLYKCVRGFETRPIVNFRVMLEPELDDSHISEIHTFALDVACKFFDGKPSDYFLEVYNGKGTPWWETYYNNVGFGCWGFAHIYDILIGEQFEKILNAKN